MDKRTFNPCDECKYGIDRRDGSGSDRMCKICEFSELLNRRTQPEITGETSDGYHTFNELYHHRAALFSVICNDRPALAWKSKLHHDGTMYDGMFIVGIETPDGQATYHYDIEPYWEMFNAQELPQAPEWDGHTPAQAIERIGKLNTQPENEPLTCEGCVDKGQYENEVEYGYPSPCTRCKRRSLDNYRHKPERSEG